MCQKRRILVAECQMSYTKLLEADSLSSFQCHQQPQQFTPHHRIESLLGKPVPILFFLQPLAEQRTTKITYQCRQKHEFEGSKLMIVRIWFKETTTISSTIHPPTRAPILYPHLNALDLVIAKCTWFLCGHMWPPKIWRRQQFYLLAHSCPNQLLFIEQIRRTIWGDKDTAYCIGHALIGIQWCWILSIKST